MIKADSKKFHNKSCDVFEMPKYNPCTHYLHLTKHKYYLALVYLRSYIKLMSDYYFGVKVNAKNIDLFMLTPSVSSPMGPGSDSEAIPIKFGNVDSFLVDSSQFGFEPLLLNGLNKVYCYLPSMRGEDFDNRHLNQFYHCEMEMLGTQTELKPIIEEYIKKLSETLLEAEDIIRLISKDVDKTKTSLNNIIKQKKFKEISFDEAVKVLEQNRKKHLVNYTKKGRDISSEGEVELMRILKVKTPIWVNNFDRDRVPFYQKPSKDDLDKVVNADLLFPPLLKNSFGGEIVGCGERQSDVKEMYKSLERQNLSTEAYEWYIDLRRQSTYSTTSGFGMGIERFIAWALAQDDIKNATIYPRLKGVVTYP